MKIQMLLRESADTERNSGAFLELHRMSCFTGFAHVADGHCSMTASSSKYLSFLCPTSYSFCLVSFPTNRSHPNSDRFPLFAVNQRQSGIFSICCLYLTSGHPASLPHAGQSLDSRKQKFNGRSDVFLCYLRCVPGTIWAILAHSSSPWCHFQGKE